MSLEYITITEDKIRLKKYFEEQGEYFTFSQIQWIWDIISFQLDCYQWEKNTVKK